MAEPDTFCSVIYSQAVSQGFAFCLKENGLRARELDSAQAGVLNIKRESRRSGE